jgi:endonuclease YncB( thermonuclease family)
VRVGSSADVSRSRRRRRSGHKYRSVDRDHGSLAQLGVLLFALVCAAVVAVSFGEGSRGQGDLVAEPGEYTVARVVDGDTIVLDDGRRVRLAQIDTPELNENECFAKAAQATLASMLPVGSRVSLRRDPALDDVDQYGRLIRYVIDGRINVNLALVRRGAASVWFVDGDRGRQAKQFLRAARHARRSSFGLWRTCPHTQLDTAHGVQTDRTSR